MQTGDHLDGVREAQGHLVDAVRRAGLEAPVPTTPGWTVRDLVSHQGAVHRWATAHLRGERDVPAYDDAAGLGESDPVGWLQDGCVDLLTAFDEAPEDLEALVFLPDAPPAKPFWARRQCHETTIHAVDMLAALHGRFPAAADTWIPPDVAVDGIDELLRGFLTRPRSTLRSDRPVSYSVRPTDADGAWTIHVSAEPAVTDREFDADADVVLEAPAAALYLALWNRSDEVAPRGSQEAWDRWRRTAQVG